MKYRAVRRRSVVIGIGATAGTTPLRHLTLSSLRKDKGASARLASDVPESYA